MRVGIPQSHISKIEHGQVDLQSSTLVELARALDLELMLVPRALVPAFQTLQLNVREEATPLYHLEEDENHE